MQQPIKVWKDTQKIGPEYPFRVSEKITEEDLAPIEPRPPSPSTETKKMVKVVFQDTLTCAERLVQNHGFTRVLILNFANNAKPGGCVDDGFGAQEEDLFRRSNLFCAVPKELYPIDTVFPPGSLVEREGTKKLALLYSPHVSVFKKSEKFNFETMPTFFNVSVITCAALMDPSSHVLGSTRKRFYAKTSDRDLMRRKIEMLLIVALREGFYGPKTAVILGAWGCGAFGNPEDEVAAIFNEVISRYPSNCFFAIKGDFEKEKDRKYQAFVENIVQTI
jgi:uncharacterized protein (TIGR02452 family)